ncbi:MAG: iron ABC transporter permease [Alphaproteobacteria bacterium]
MKEVSALADGAAQGLPRRSLACRYRGFVRVRMLWLAVFAMALIASILLNIVTGPADLSLKAVLNGILNPSDLSAGTYVILWEVRLPIAVMAVLVGACLGLAGAEMQTVLNNPLASPATLGLSYAATLGASLAIAFNLADPFGLSEEFVSPFFAFFGAVAAMSLIQTLSRLYGATLEVVILFGIALVFALQALVSLVQFVADSNSLQQIVFWTMGSVARATWLKIGIVGAVLVVTACMSWMQIWKLTALRTGEDFAEGAGVGVKRLRMMTLLRVSVLAAIAVCFTGVIGFVGLVAPHVARLAVGEDHRFYLPASVLAGAFILSSASIASKSLIPGILIPDGIVTALVGVPLFLVLVLTQMRRGH